jgi:hypothetical protein
MVMTRRTRISIVLLALTFIAHEIWQVWKGDNREVNWWIANHDYPLSIQWYFKFLGIQVKELLFAIVIYRITYKIQSLRNVAIVVLIYAIVDLAMFFINFNQASYTLIYTTVGVISIIVFEWRQITKPFYKHKHEESHHHSTISH